ncbi:MAG: sensor histidine kinase [Chloroflexi bacterium]|nr:sensor histidine kinase [Chloroflexota bacterium]
MTMLIGVSPQLTIHQDERLQALYHLAVELSALRSLESVLNTALQHCLDLTGSQFGFIGLNTPDSRAMDVVDIQGFHPSEPFYRHNHLIPLRPNVFARTVLENRPVRSAAIVIRNAQLYEQLTSANEELERKVASRTQELEEAKEALAQKASQLQQLLTETVNVQERERQRIAQDMHDGTNQLLIGAMLELKSARERLTTGNLAGADTSLKTVQDILRRVESETKRIIYDLRPPTLDALGLAPAIRRYAERFEQYAGLPCSVRVLGEPTRLPTGVEISVYRLMQEALQNVSAHAQARQAEVIITFAPQTLKLVIKDDGRGFDLAAAQGHNNGSFGLLSMRERTESLGGRLSILTHLGEGTQVELVVPVRANGQLG